MNEPTSLQALAWELEDLANSADYVLEAIDELEDDQVDQAEVDQLAELAHRLSERLDRLSEQLEGGGER